MYSLLYILFSDLPNPLQCIVYKLDDSLTDFSRAVLKVLKDCVGKDELKIIPNNNESFNSTDLDNKCVLFYTNTQRQDELGAYSRHRRIVLDNRPDRIDNMNIYGSVDRMISHLSDQIINYYEKQHIYFKRLGHLERADRLKYTIRKICENTSVVRQLCTEKQRALYQNHKTRPVLIHLQKSDESKSICQYLQETVAGFFDDYRQYTDVNTCENDIQIIGQTHDIFLFVSALIAKFARERLRSLPHVRYSYVFLAKHSNEGLEDIRLNQLFTMVSDLGEYHHEFAKFHQLNGDYERFRESLGRSKAAYNFLSEKLL